MFLNKKYLKKYVITLNIIFLTAYFVRSTLLSAITQGK